MFIMLNSFRSLRSLTVNRLTALLLFLIIVVGTAWNVRNCLMMYSYSNAWNVWTSFERFELVSNFAKKNNERFEFLLPFQTFRPGFKFREDNKWTFFFSIICCFKRFECSELFLLKKSEQRRTLWLGPLFFLRRRTAAVRVRTNEMFLCQQELLFYFANGRMVR